MSQQAEQELRRAVQAACDALGPRVVTAIVLAQTARQARADGGLEDELRVLHGWTVDMQARTREAVAAARAAGAPWPTIARALELPTREAMARYGDADPTPGGPPTRP